MRLHSIVLIALLVSASPALADTCNLEATLASKGKELPRIIGVPKRDQDYIASLGIELRKGLFGAKYIETDDLIAILALKGCDEGLLDWAVKSTKKPTGGSSKDSGESDGEDTGGGEGPGSGPIA